MGRRWFFCLPRNIVNNYPAYFGGGTKLTVLELCSADVQYFGTGTKLTVLDREISEPNVKILQPSKQEIKVTKRVTLVCVATDFYPDHVDIEWYVNGLLDKTHAKMDHSAVRSTQSQTYSITSRLRLSVEKWHSSKSTFLCSVKFHGLNESITVNATTQGSQYCGVTAEENKRRGKMAQFSYLLFLMKSVLFALILIALGFKMKGSKKSTL